MYYLTQPLKAANKIIHIPSEARGSSSLGNLDVGGANKQRQEHWTNHHITTSFSKSQWMANQFNAF